MTAIAGVNGDVWLSTSPSTPLLPIKDAVSNSSTASGASLTWSHTVTNAQSNLILMVAVAVGGSATCSGVTYAGAAMTQLTSKAQGTETTYIFYKLAPATGANNVVASFSGTVAGIGLGVSYYNVAQSSTFGTVATNSGGSGNSSNTVTVTSTSQLVLDINFANGSSSTVGSAQNVETSNTAVAPFYFADLTSTSSSSMPLAWTNAGSPTIWIEMSVALFPNPETATDSGDHIHYFTSVHQAWDQSQAIIVQNSPNGTTGWVTVTDYQFFWPVGEIVFNTARGVGTNNFTRVLQGNYFTLSALDGAHAWKANFKGQTKDVTPFQASGSWAVNLATLKNLTFSVDCFRYDARILQEMVTGVGQTNISGGIVMCQLWFNEAGGQRWQFYGLPTGITDNVVVNDVDKQSVNFTATGPVYLITSNTFSTTTVTQM